MRFEALATDYDGTLAHAGRVEESGVAALERLRASGRRTLLVTGREIEDLKQIFPRLELFDLVVGENGAVLYFPAEDRLRTLHRPPPESFVEAMRERAAGQVSQGHVIVALRQPDELVALQVIKELGLELEIIFNKGSVMVLPTGVNKATGLKAGLAELNLPHEKVVGVGDAENDHALLRCCGCGVALDNAVPALKETADMVTKAANGRGVVELIDLLIETDLAWVTKSVSPSCAPSERAGKSAGQFPQQ